jgi:hypothetical protein
MAAGMGREGLTGDDDRLQLMQGPLRKISTFFNGMYCCCEVAVLFVAAWTIVMFENLSFVQCGKRKHPWIIIEANLRSGLSTTEMKVKMRKASCFHRCV